MLTALIAACGLWGVTWYFGKPLSSAWGILVPVTLMPLLLLPGIDLHSLKYIVTLAMLATLGMLFHERLRHYLLLPSCIALVGGLTALSVTLHGI